MLHHVPVCSGSECKLLPEYFAILDLLRFNINATLMDLNPSCQLIMLQWALKANQSAALIKFTQEVNLHTGARCETAIYSPYSAPSLGALPF